MNDLWGMNIGLVGCIYEGISCLQILSQYEHGEGCSGVMAEAIGAKLVKVADIQPEEISGYDLLGFGSGIYGGKHHKTLIELVENMPAMAQNVFIFLQQEAREKNNTRS